MTLDDEELEIVMLAIGMASENFAYGKTVNEYLEGKFVGVLKRIRQHQEDRKNGDA